MCLSRLQSSLSIGLQQNRFFSTLLYRRLAALVECLAVPCASSVVPVDWGNRLNNIGKNDIILYFGIVALVVHFYFFFAYFENLNNIQLFIKKLINAQQAEHSVNIGK